MNASAAALPIDTRTAARARHATRALFATLGTMAGVWGAHVPSVKLHYGLDEGTLALALLCGGLGAVLSLFVAGRFIARIGTRHAAGLTGLVMVLCVANHRAEKDYDNLMDAMALLVAREKDDGEGSAPLTVVAAGAGPLLDDARRRATALGLDGRLQMLGHRDDVGSLMAAADAFVLASRFEGLPVALMEATAAGLPVVATRVGGIPEALAGEAGELLVPPQNPEALAALARLGDPQLRRRLSEASRVAAMQFDASQAVTAQELMYAELVS